MQITDEMVGLAAQSDVKFDGNDDFAALSRAQRERYIARSRAALEAALGESKEYAKLKEEHEAMGRARCDAAACIEDLAGALKEVISVSDRATDIYDRARATLERWGLK